MADISQRELKALLSYDPDTGVFVRKVQTCGRVKVGQVAGCVGTSGYVVISVLSRKYVAHRLAWFYVHGIWPPHELDHVNRCRTDNRIANLRLATRSQNQMNRVAGTNSQSGYKGVSTKKWRNKTKWCAKIKVGHKVTLIGYFNTKHEAIDAYKREAPKYHGEFAQT